MIRPMLASPVDLGMLSYPVYVSPKYDGVRAVIGEDGKVYSRSGKLIPSPGVQRLFGRKDLAGLDGELIVGSPTASDVYRKTVSWVMSQQDIGLPLSEYVTFMAFDLFNLKWPYAMRISELMIRVYRAGFGSIQCVGQTKIVSEKQLLEYEENCVGQGYEGIMIRSITGPYKHGRSTVRQGYLLKMKRFSDSEAVILGVNELMHNENEPEYNALGYTERATKKDGMVRYNTLGSLQVKDIHTGVEFSIGTGFSAALRQSLWNMHDELKGKLVKYTFFEVGVKDKPRFPVFKGFRNSEDL